MTGKRKIKANEMVSSSKEGLIDWNWLFVQCPRIFAVLVAIGFVLILGWILL